MSLRSNGFEMLNIGSNICLLKKMISIHIALQYFNKHKKYVAHTNSGSIYTEQCLVSTLSTILDLFTEPVAMHSGIPKIWLKQVSLPFKPAVSSEAHL